MSLFDYNYLAHIGRSKLDGAPIGSGRYRLGSGEDPYQHMDLASYLALTDAEKKEVLKDIDPSDFLGFPKELSKDVKLKNNPTAIGKILGLSSNEYRETLQYMKAQQRNDIKSYIRWQAEHDGVKASELSPTKIARSVGVSEGKVRLIIKEMEGLKEERKRVSLENTVNAIKDEFRLNGKKYLDVGAGNEYGLGCSQQRLNAAIKQLVDREGYVSTKIHVKQQGVTGNQWTTLNVLAPPGTTIDDIKKHRKEITPIVGHFTKDNGETYKTFEDPSSISASRVFIRYAEDHGADRDGLIEIRPGVPDLSLGKSSYAQARIMVDNKAFLKGVAIYSDDVPDGYDVVFNTNKDKSVPMFGTNEKKDNGVLKPLKDDPNNPFGALIMARGQTTTELPNGKTVLSAVNKVREEGEWDTWSKKVSSQFLSKQTTSLAKKQLDLTYKELAADFDDIKALPNEAIRKKLLTSFADECDRVAVDLKAVPFPRQENKLLLPIPSLKDGECYCPTYKNGETLALIRYPHAGRFEIPIVKVNNNNKEGKKLIRNAQDAIGINHSAASQLSGADFDGDTVMAIPIKSATNPNGPDIKSHKVLRDLENFDPQTAFAGYDGMKVISEDNKQREMGVISNLINDMTLKGCTLDSPEMVRAVKYSMVVIDSKKHKLDYKAAKKILRINELHQKWQPEGGASTLISRARAEIHVPEFKEAWAPDPETGKIEKTNTNRIYLDYKTGKEKEATKTVKALSYKTPEELMSKPGTKMEMIYADFSNKVKSMANDARKETISIKAYPLNQSAAEAYKDEAESLRKKVEISLKNAPLERQAQMIANDIVWRKYKSVINDIGYKEWKKEKGKVRKYALDSARHQVGAISKDSRKIVPTDREWQAIQSRGIHMSTVERILNEMDEDDLKKRVFPKTRAMSPAMKVLIRQLAENHTPEQIAQMKGFSVSAVKNVLYG